MKITLDIADADINRALHTAAEYGIAYWASKIDWLMPAVPNIQGVKFPFRITGYVIERSNHDKQAERHELDIKRGLRIMYQGAGNADIVNRSKGLGRGEDPSYWDANQADAFVQYAAFGELRYG